MNTEKCFHYTITGTKVQGIGFRYNAKKVAMQMDITGYAKNFLDGHVEILACGEPEDLEEFNEWIYDGLQHGKNVKVVCNKNYQTDCEYTTFERLMEIIQDKNSLKPIYNNAFI